MEPQGHGCAWICGPKGASFCHKSAPQYYCPIGYKCPDTVGTYGPCAPPGATWCAGKPAWPPYCEVGFTCVHDKYCMPPRGVVCDGASPPFCPYGSSCVEGHACAPPNATACSGHEPPYCVYGARCVDSKTCVFDGNKA